MSLNFIPTGTVNYYPYTFNKITSERKILFEGAVPLHEIVYTLYDLFLYYINNTSINIDTYFTAIVKDNNKCVVRTIELFKGKTTKKHRIKKLKEVVPNIFLKINKCFGEFLDDGNKFLKEYRSDLNPKTLIKAREDFNGDIKDKINNLLK
jgi:hypothetical protein|tara:strand:+ start:2394 stop:2846 length:453 start_codon:yes stop_codon:yes gene_type:complete